MWIFTSEFFANENVVRNFIMDSVFFIFFFWFMSDFVGGHRRVLKIKNFTMAYFLSFSYGWVCTILETPYKIFTPFPFSFSLFFLLLLFRSEPNQQYYFHIMYCFFFVVGLSCKLIPLPMKPFKQYGSIKIFWIRLKVI